MNFAVIKFNVNGVRRAVSGFCRIYYSGSVTVLEKRVKKQIDSLASLGTDGELESPHIEISKNERAVVEGSRGIIEYDGSVVRINCGRLILKFCGRDLRIKALASDVLLITGEFVSVGFCS